MTRSHTDEAEFLRDHQDEVRALVRRWLIPSRTDPRSLETLIVGFDHIPRFRATLQTRELPAMRNLRIEPLDMGAVRGDIFRSGDLTNAHGYSWTSWLDDARDRCTRRARERAEGRRFFAGEFAGIKRMMSPVYYEEAHRDTPLGVMTARLTSARARAARLRFVLDIEYDGPTDIGLGIVAQGTRAGSEYVFARPIRLRPKVLSVLQGGVFVAPEGDQLAVMPSHPLAPTHADALAEHYGIEVQL